MSHRQSGLTIVELLIVISVIGILVALVFIGIPNSQARARDVERTADIDTLHSRLEEFYTDNGGYPSTLAISQFPSLDPAVLEDPDGDPIDVRTPVASQADAKASPNPDKDGAEYVYIPYPASCSGANCRGYLLKSFIENPTEDVANPYVRGGLNNN